MESPGIDQETPRALTGDHGFDQHSRQAFIRWKIVTCGSVLPRTQTQVSEL